jgi:preprotein translocase subunit YajC
VAGEFIMVIMLKSLCLLLWLIIIFFLIRAQVGRAREARGKIIKIERGDTKRPAKKHYYQNK